MSKANRRLALLFAVLSSKICCSLFCLGLPLVSEKLWFCSCINVAGAELSSATSEMFPITSSKLCSDETLFEDVWTVFTGLDARLGSGMRIRSRFKQTLPAAWSATAKFEAKLCCNDDSCISSSKVNGGITGVSSPDWESLIFSDLQKSQNNSCKGQRSLQIRISAGPKMLPYLTLSCSCKCTSKPILMTAILNYLEVFLSKGQFSKILSLSDSSFAFTGCYKQQSKTKINTKVMLHH